MRQVSTNHPRYVGAIGAWNGRTPGSRVTTGTSTMEDPTETRSLSSGGSPQVIVPPMSPSLGGDDESLLTSSGSVNTSISPLSNESFRRATVTGSRTAKTYAVVVCGPAGIGKSSLINQNQRMWKANGLWGHAKFMGPGSPPYANIVSWSSSHRDVWLMFGQVRLPIRTASATHRISIRCPSLHRHTEGEAWA